MDILDILVLVLVVVLAAVYLVWAVRKKKWCPDVFGSGTCVVEKQKKDER